MHDAIACSANGDKPDLTTFPDRSASNAPTRYRLPELMRILLDSTATVGHRVEHHHSLQHTCHTLLPEALESGQCPHLKLLPP